MDTPVKEGWLYVVKAKVFHEEEGGGAGAGDGAAAEAEGAGRKGSRLAMMTGWTAGRKGSKSKVTTRLVLWDMRDGKEMSAPAVKTGEWEVGAAANHERSLGVARRGVRVNGTVFKEGGVERVPSGGVGMVGAPGRVSSGSTDRARTILPAVSWVASCKESVRLEQLCVGTVLWFNLD